MDFPQALVGGPDDRSKFDQQEFVAFVEKGGEVQRRYIELGVPNAKMLAVFKEKGGRIICSAALKNPSDVYRANIERKIKLSLSKKEFPFELGYIRTDDNFLKKGFAKQLVSLLVSEIGGLGIFATSSAENFPMHTILSKNGFTQIGLPYKSSDQSHDIKVFIRKGV